MLTHFGLEHFGNQISPASEEHTHYVIQLEARVQTQLQDDSLLAVSVKNYMLQKHKCFRTTVTSEAMCYSHDNKQIVSRSTNISESFLMPQEQSADLLCHFRLRSTSER